MAGKSTDGLRKGLVSFHVQSWGLGLSQGYVNLTNYDRSGPYPFIHASCFDIFLCFCLRSRRFA